MRDDRLEVSVTFDSAKGYISSAPELRTSVVALSLGGLRRRIEVALLPDNSMIVLQLDALAERYRLFHQRFFRQPSALAIDPGVSIIDFARLLASVANHTAKEAPGDAERAYRLSLKLRPDENLAHGGLALLLAETGRTREAAREAALALGVLDAFAQRARDRAEDIYPFKSPVRLREALERVVAGA